MEGGCSDALPSQEKTESDEKGIQVVGEEPDNHISGSLWSPIRKSKCFSPPSISLLLLSFSLSLSLSLSLPPSLSLSLSLSPSLTFLQVAIIICSSLADVIMGI